MSFSEEVFPSGPGVGLVSGPGFLTHIVESPESGHDYRIARRDASKRRYEYPLGNRSKAEIAQVVAFIEASLGAFTSFRLRDAVDCTSSADGESTPTAFDQVVGVGDGSRTTFQLSKTYTYGNTSRVRAIKKPVEGSVVVAVNGSVLDPSEYSVDTTTGVITLDQAPELSDVVTAGFVFDVPVRFDLDTERWLRVVSPAVGVASVENIGFVEVIGEDPIDQEHYAGGSRDFVMTTNVSISPLMGGLLRLYPQSPGLSATLPDPDTFPAAGAYHACIINGGSEAVSVRDSGGELASLAAGDSAYLHLAQSASTGAKGWVLA